MPQSYRVVAPDRYLKLVKLSANIKVTYHGELVLSTDEAYQLFEGDRPPVLYFDLSDAIKARLQSSDTRYSCRWRGEAVYFHYQLDSGEQLTDALWSYTQAPDDVALLRHLFALDAARFSHHIVLKDSQE